MSLTGEQIAALLLQQCDDPNPEGANVIRVSEGFSYTWDASPFVGSRVDAGGISFDRVPVEPAEAYRVAPNSYLANGGSVFSMFTEGTDRRGGMIDLDAPIAYSAAVGYILP